MVRTRLMTALGAAALTLGVAITGANGVSARDAGKVAMKVRLIPAGKFVFGYEDKRGRVIGNKARTVFRVGRDVHFTARLKRKPNMDDYPTINFYLNNHTEEGHEDVEAGNNLFGTVVAYDMPTKGFSPGKYTVTVQEETLPQPTVLARGTLTLTK